MAQPRATPEQIRARGSDRGSRAGRRAREDAGAGKPKRRGWVETSPPARPLPATGEGWRELLLALPGYDPWRLAGSVEGGARFDDVAAARAITWIEAHCRHVKGRAAGQLLRLEDWQRAIVANLFGWRRADGVRRFRVVWMYVPRKAAKSTLAAAIALYVLCEDGEPGAEIYTAASKRDQAREVWRAADRMVQREASLLARMDCGKTYANSILLDDGESWIQPLSSEGKGEHGKSPHMVILDEVHAQATRSLYEALTTGGGAREQPILLMLTTADAPGESLCNELLAYAREVRANDGDPLKPGYDPTWLPVIYEMEEGEDWTSEEVWRRVHPLYESMPSVGDEMRAKLAEAKANPSAAASFRRWYLNVQESTSRRWIDAAEWDACGEPIPEAVLARLKGQRCFMAIDLSATRDMTALVLWFPEQRILLCWFWVPEAQAEERARRDDRTYERWARAGHLNLTEGNAIDHRAVLDQAEELAKVYRVAKVGLDPALAQQFSIQLGERGLDVEFVRQGWVTMSEPCRALDVLLARRLLRHGGHPVLRWNALNARLEEGKHGAVAPVKDRDADKIDGLVAFLMALRLASVEPPPAAGPRIRPL